MKQWNERQLEAIAARGHSVVVSAAAGSGKTSVLSERVLRLIEEGEDLSNMLVVTFTNLAAAEMKERIARRLSEAGGDPRMAAQAEKCAFADISTIHAFCGRVIRDNFEQAGVSPVYAVADEAGISAMKQSAMDDAIEQAAGNPEMRPFFEKFAPRGDTQRVKDNVSLIYNRVISLDKPGEWLDRSLSNLCSENFIETLFSEYVLMVREAAGRASLHLAER